MNLLFSILLVLSPASRAASRWMPSFCETALTKATDFGDRHLAMSSAPWILKPETESRIAALPSDMDDVSRVNETIRLVMTDHALSYRSKLRKFFFDRALRSGLDPDHWYGKTIGHALGSWIGPHQIAFTNWISLTGLDAADPGRGIPAIHEINHAFDQAFHSLKSLATIAVLGWNFNRLILRNPLAPYLHNRFERSSIGAQWELVHRLPAEVRARMIANIDELTFAPPPSAERVHAYEAIVSSDLLTRFTRALETLERKELLPSRAFGAEVLLVNHEGERESPLRGYRTALFELIAEPETSVRKRQAVLSVGADELDLVNRLTRDAEAVTKDLPTVALTEEQRASFRNIVEIHQKIHSSGREKSLRLITKTSLENADLSKKEFIERLEPIHGYNVENLTQHYLVKFWTGWRKILLIQAAYQLAVGGTTFMATDIQWVFDHLPRLFWH